MCTSFALLRVPGYPWSATMYGRIFAPQDVSAGTCSDAIMVSVNF